MGVWRGSDEVSPRFLRLGIGEEGGGVGSGSQAVWKDGMIHCTLGKSPQGTKEHFEVCFTASFKGKTVQCTMNELYRSGATREAA